MSEEVKKTRRVRAWVRGVLVVSLALNVAVAGVVVGAMLRFGPMAQDKRPPRQDEVFGMFTRALSEEDRRQIGRQIRAQQRDSLPSRAQFRADKDQLVALLQAESFDAEAAAEILARQRAFGAARAELGHQVLLDHLAQMNAEKRAAFAERLAASGPPERRDRPPRKP